MAILQTNDAFPGLQKLVETLSSRVNSENAAHIKRFISEAQLGKTVLRRQKKKLGDSVCYKYGKILIRLDNFWGKPFDKVAVKDMERFIKELESGRFESSKGKPYAYESQQDFKKTIKKFFKWLHRAEFPDGDAAKFYELTYWIDSSKRHREVPALNREQIKRLTAGAILRDRVLVWVLFDSGMRAQEFLNIKVSDVEREDTHFKVRVRHEYSKTKGRTISLSMAETVEILDLWLSQHPSRKDGTLPETARLVPISYPMIRKRLGVLGERVLNRRVTAHMLRHSSATYFASKLSQYQLCYRYGWSMSSSMPERYIDRSGIAEEQTVRLERADQLREVREENKEVQEEMVLMRDQNQELAKRLKELQDVVSILSESPEVMKAVKKLTS